MTLFHYKAYTAKGKVKKGMIDAESASLAKERMEKWGLFIFELFKAETPKDLKIDTKTKLIFFKDLCELLDGGISLYDALLAIEEKWRSEQIHMMIIDLCDHVKHGKPLSLAMSRYPKSFDPISIAMISAGEQTGLLASSLKSLTLATTKREKITGKIKSALSYPLFLLFFSLSLLTFILLGVIPSIEQLFDGRSLHPVTEAVFSLSHWLMNYGLFTLSSIAALTLLTFYLAKGVLRPWLGTLLLHIPLIGPMITESVLSRFFRTLSTLLQSHLPILEALLLSKQTITHPHFALLIQKSIDGLLEGKKLSDIMQSSPFIPSFTLRLLSTAESSGNLGAMTSHLAETYEEHLTESLEKFSALIQPLLILLLGLMIGTILLAVVIPLTDVSSFLENN